MFKARLFKNVVADFILPSHCLKGICSTGWPDKSNNYKILKSEQKIK
jgi:hypothetical protein